MNGFHAGANGPNEPRWYIGVDGGGTGTRVTVSDGRKILFVASGGPAALSLGIDNAWNAITQTCNAAFDTVAEKLSWEQSAVGIGIAGAHHETWKAEFLQKAPAAAHLIVETDSRTSLIGAHAGKPGVCIALGTGSVGEVLREDGSTHVVGGFGLPAGDEASGAWMGVRAAGLVQRSIDGRSEVDELVTELLARAAGGLERVRSEITRSEFMRWHSSARATDFATLVPTLFAHPRHPFVRDLVDRAVTDVEFMINTLDPSGKLNVALCGSIGELLKPYLRSTEAVRLVKPTATAAAGALMLIAKDVQLPM